MGLHDPGRRGHAITGRSGQIWGKVRYVGISDTPAWVVSRANTMAEMRGWTPFVSLQVPYSLVDRDPERELLPMARSLGLGLCAWAVLAEGLLTGKYTRKPDKGQASKGRLTQPDWGISERGKIVAEKVDQIAEGIGRPPSQVALNWVRQQEGVVIPIVGATKPAQMQENLESLNFRLTQDQMKQLDEATRIQLGFPSDFLNSSHVKGIIFGDTYSLTDH